MDVIDKGPGIELNDRVRLFEPFQRGVTAQQGAGLGLALVGQIARAHGGDAMFVDSAIGAHLRVRLPRRSPTTLLSHAKHLRYSQTASFCEKTTPLSSRAGTSRPKSVRC